MEAFRHIEAWPASALVFYVDFNISNDSESTEVWFALDGSTSRYVIQGKCAVCARPADMS